MSAETLRDLCSFFGIPRREGEVRVDCLGNTRQSPWSGSALFDAPERDLYHEIGHWLVAEPAHRQYGGFGFGASYDGLSSPEADGPYLLDGSETSEDLLESTASALGILLHFADDREAGEGHADYHGWDRYPFLCFLYPNVESARTFLRDQSTVASDRARVALERRGLLPLLLNPTDRKPS